MTIAVNTNISGAALRGIHSIHQINAALFESLARTQTGNKILRASDNPSGLVTVLVLDANINSAQTQYESNQDTLAGLATVDDGLTSMLKHLQDMRALVDEWEVAPPLEQADIEQALEDLSAMIDPLAATTQFNAKAVLGADNGPQTIRWGTASGNTIDIDFLDMREDDGATGRLDLDANGAGTDFAAGLAAAGGPDNIRAAIDGAIDDATLMAGRIGRARDQVFSPQNDFLNSSIGTWTDYRDLLMRTDVVEESARTARLEAMRTAALDAFRVQNDLVRKSTIDLMG